MRIPVAGGQGQLGRALADLGSEKNLKLVALGRAEFDITKPSSIAEVFKSFRPDILVNGAAYTSVDDAELESKLAHEINEFFAVRISVACAK